MKPKQYPPLPKNWPKPGTRMRVIMLNDMSERIGEVYSPYVFDGIRKFPFLEDGKQVGEMITLRLDEVIVREIDI